MSYSQLRELLRGKEQNDVSNKASLGFETSIREHVYQNQCKENLVRSVGLSSSLKVQEGNELVANRCVARRLGKPAGGV